MRGLLPLITILVMFMIGIIERIFKRKKRLNDIYTNIVKIAEAYGIHIFLDSFGEKTVYITAVMPEGIRISDIENFYTEVSNIVGEYKVDIRVI